MNTIRWLYISLLFLVVTVSVTVWAVNTPAVWVHATPTRRVPAFGPWATTVTRVTLHDRPLWVTILPVALGLATLGCFLTCLYLRWGGLIPPSRNFLPWRKCYWCGKTFWGLPRLAWIRWGVPEYCSKKCADDEADFVDSIYN